MKTPLKKKLNLIYCLIIKKNTFKKKKTLDGHTSNVSSVMFHPKLPIVLTGAEDGTVRFWHSKTYRSEKTLNYGMERVWTLSCLPDSNKVAIGYDDGVAMIKVEKKKKRSCLFYILFTLSSMR